VVTVAVVAGAVWALAAAGASWADARIARPERAIRARERREKWILSR
jgi:hypothetical protein